MNTDLERPTMSLLRMIGSPFISKSSAIELIESSELYEYAFKNRVELLYLESLKRSRVLDSLQTQYDNLKYRHHETLVTAAKIAKLLNSENIPYVVIKTLRPFPALPNDVDILFLGSHDRYQEAVDIMCQAGYVNFEIAANQHLFWDSRSNEPMMGTSKEGGIYYLDLYKDIAVQHFIYMDKSRLLSYLRAVEILDDQKITVLKPEIELALLMMHSVFPTQACGLEMFYTTLYWLKDLGRNQYRNFIEFVSQNRIEHAVRLVLGIIASLHNAAFDNIPEVINDLSNHFGSSKRAIRRLAENDYLMPYEFTLDQFLFAFTGKMFEKTSFSSFLVQLFHMLNPRFTAKVTRQLLAPRIRKKRYDHV